MAEYRQFGQHLSASPYRSLNKPIVFVSGFYDNLATSPTSSEDSRRDSRESGEDSSTVSPLVILNPNMEMYTHDGVINVDLNVAPSMAFPGSECPVGRALSRGKSTISDDSFQKEFKGVMMGNQKRDSTGGSHGGIILKHKLYYDSQKSRYIF